MKRRYWERKVSGYRSWPKDRQSTLLGTKNGLTALLRTKFCWASLLSSNFFESVLNVFLLNVRSQPRANNRT